MRAIFYSLLFFIRTLQAVSNSTNGCRSSNDRPIQAGAYTEYNRPQIHYSPSSGFMNDPNGLVYSEGVYHLYYQYNPYQREAGNQHWGHATSTDLLHWENQAMAIYPDRVGDGIFSGSAVVDVNNTSGFFNASVPAQRRIVAMYTLFTPTAQTQEIAYSLDGGYSFIKYSANPVIDLNSTQFRDPKVFWHPATQRWVVATVLAQQYQVIFFTSPDLKNWTEVSRFGPAGWLGFQYEVPDLVELPIEGTNETKWVLFLSINPGAPQGGSFIENFIGDFNGTHFLPDDYAIATQDFGKDFYAMITFDNLPSDQGVVGIAWASNWEYTNDLPASGDWRTIQSLARRLTLAYTNPNPEVQRLVVRSTPTSLTTLDPQTIYSAQNGSAADNTSISTSLEATALSSYPAFDFNITVSSSLSLAAEASLVIDLHSNDTYRSEMISIGYQNSQLWVDRSGAQRAWYNPFFTDKISAFVQPLPVDTQTPGVSLYGIVDRSVLELFVNDGLQSAVVLFFMSDGLVPGSISARVEEMQEVSLTVRALDSVWTCSRPQSVLRRSLDEL